MAKSKSSGPVCECEHSEHYHINPENHTIKERRCTKAGCQCKEYKEAN